MKEKITELVNRGFDVSHRRLSVGPLERPIFNKLQYQVHLDVTKPFSEVYDTPEEAVEVFLKLLKELGRA